MKIVVFLKQVPDNTKVKFDAQGNLAEGTEMMLNPFDEYALETALRLKEKSGGEATVTAISLGAASAREVLKKAIAVGCDDAFLLSDPVFEGGDSTATSFALAHAVQRLVPGFQVLVFGQQALDDAAGQVGPQVAEWLGLPSLTFCKSAEGEGNGLKITRETERGIETHEMDLPGVVCLMKCDYELRNTNIKGVMKANKTEIPVKTAEDLGLEAGKIGTAGSTTLVAKRWQRPPKAAGVKVDGVDAKAAASQLLEFLKSSKVL